MIKLNVYITEAWSGVKKQSLKADIETWCEEMGIKNYNINFKWEIDVYGDVYLRHNTFKELPYKFGTVTGRFDMEGCKNLISLKNCPYYVRKDFSCNSCQNLDSLEGCPEKVDKDFYCFGCKRKFTKDDVRSLCKVKGDILV